MLRTYNSGQGLLGLCVYGIELKLEGLCSGSGSGFEVEGFGLSLGA